jgi:hypothetical protein
VTSPSRARTVRLVLAGLYLLTAAASLVIGTFYADDIVARLPELIVSAEAIGGAAAALAILFAAIGLAHAALAIRLGPGHRWARVGAVVGGTGLVFGLGVSAVAALVTTATQPQAAIYLLLAAGVLAGLAAIEAYLVASAAGNGRPEAG